MGTEVPANLTGINLTDSAALADRDMIFGEQFDHDIANIHIPSQSLEARWVIAGNWKLIEHTSAQGTKTRTELFNLKADPHEHENLAQKHPQRVAKLLKAINDWWTPHYPKPRGDKSTPL